MTEYWPLQKACNAFYGNPRGANGGASSKWEAANLTLVKCPWTLRYSGAQVKGIRVHRKVAASLTRVLNAIWERVGRSQAEIDRIGMSIYGGGYNFRLMRGSSNLSMHAWGCAIDFDPARNGLGDKTPAMDRRVIEEFEREGWEWGGHWSRADGMHFQAAWTRPLPPRLNALSLPPEPANDDDAPEPELIVTGPQSMAESKTGHTAVAIGIGGVAGVAQEISGAAAKAAAGSGKLFTLAEFAVALSQSPTFWVSVLTVGGAVFVWLERRAKLIKWGV